MPILREQLCSCLGRLLKSQLDVFAFAVTLSELLNSVAVGSVKCSSARDSTKGNANWGFALFLKDLFGFHQGFWGLWLKSLLLLKSPEVRWRALGGKTMVMRAVGE